MDSRYKVAGGVVVQGGTEPIEMNVPQVQGVTGTADVAPPQPTATEGAHPLVVSPEEGLFAVPQETMLTKLQGLLRKKYTGVIMYMNYGDRIRAHFRDSIYDHFKEHIKDERAGAYDLAMKITALGGEPKGQSATVPDLNDLHQIFAQIILAEKELIQAERDVLKVVGENTGLKVLIENMVLVDQRHLDDARRMFFCEGSHG